jgi:hypothetical protein
MSGPRAAEVIPGLLALVAESDSVRVPVCIAVPGSPASPGDLTATLCCLRRSSPAGSCGLG